MCACVFVQLAMQRRSNGRDFCTRCARYVWWIDDRINIYLAYLSTTNLVKTKSRLKKTGFECSWLTALSINGCDLMKFNTVSGKLDVSSTHVPGRGSGIFDLRTGNHAEFDVACSLNLPTNNAKKDIFTCSSMILGMWNQLAERRKIPTNWTTWMAEHLK